MMLLPGLKGATRRSARHAGTPALAALLLAGLALPAAAQSAAPEASAPQPSATPAPDTPLPQQAGTDPADAQDTSDDTTAQAMTIGAPRHTISLAVGSGKMLHLPASASSVFVADPSVADVQTPTAAGVFLFGRKPGRTTLFALGRNGRTIASFILAVEYDRSALDAAFRAEAGDLPVRLMRLPHALVLTGIVPTASAASQLDQFARGFLAGNDTLLDQLVVSTPVQVNLRVRVAEVSRSVSRSLGFNWATVFKAGSFLLGVQTGFSQGGTALANSLGSLGTGTTAAATGQLANVFGSGGNLGASVASSQANGTLTLDAMADEGLVTMLAEPNLTTTSGEPATFLAGGEYPIPIPQALGVTSIEYKKYGVSVAFTPTVLSSGMISLKVTPEVSSLSTQGETTLNGTTVPALITRRADTTVQLASGQSFAIAGLLQNNAANNVQKVPWLGDIPLLGALFRSTQFQRDQTELMIVVTAYTVQPSDRMPQLPTDAVRQPTDFERLLLGRVAARAGPAFDPETAPRLQGSAGFMFQ